MVAQTDFEKYRQSQQEKFDQQKRQHQQRFDNRRDSLNRVYAAVLEKAWKSFDLQRQERGFKPMSNPPVYQPDTPKPEPEKPPIVPTPDSPKPKPESEKPQPPAPKSEPVAPQPTLNTNFFGATITVRKIETAIPHLSGISEKEVATYWAALSKLKIEELTNEILRLKTELRLNDWGVYLLINTLFNVYFPAGSENEKTVFNVFTLNQLGYLSKIGRSQNELVLLLAFSTQVFNVPFFVYGSENAIKYSVVSNSRKELSAVQTCQMDYAGATKTIEMTITASPLFGDHIQTKTCNDHQYSYSLQYNKNLTDFYATYPCIDFSVYAEAPLDAAFSKSIESQIIPKIRGKSQEEAVNFLLHFVQYAFEYKTDTEQFGYEKWNFAEETLYYPFSDCEDRAILFAQLVRRYLNMPVALIHYPMLHLAAAVKFNNPATVGDYIVVDEQKYLICDPTYIGATLGMGMPQLKTSSIEIIKLSPNSSYVR